MGAKITSTGLDESRRLIQFALQAQRAIEVILDSEREAKAFRFRVYQARKLEKEQLALLRGCSVEAVSHIYDNLKVTIETVSDDPYDPRRALRISPIDRKELIIRDVETGKQLELFDADDVINKPLGALNDKHSQPSSIEIDPFSMDDVID